MQNKTYLIEIYYDWVNNYLTIEKYADHNGLHIHQAHALIELAKMVANSSHPDS